MRYNEVFSTGNFISYTVGEYERILLLYYKDIIFAYIINLESENSIFIMSSVDREKYGIEIIHECNQFSFMIFDFAGS